MKHKIKYILITIGLVFVSLLYVFPQVIYCQLVAFSGFQDIARDCYVGKGISPRRYNAILRTKTFAENRINALYSGKKSEPTLIICATEAEYRRFCNSNEGSGCSIGTPWGRNFVIISNAAMNVDVMSHEMSHIELLVRVGWLKTWTDIPQWFNEGLAMMVDHRFVNAPDFCGKYEMYRQEWIKLLQNGQPSLGFDELSNVEGFIGQNADQNYMAYIASSMELSGWLASNKNSPNIFLDKLRNGASFKEQYEFVDFTKTPCGK